MSAPSTTAAPISAPPLYRHALESVFRYASLSDLVRITRVCHSWLAAAHSMAPIRGAVRLGAIRSPQLRAGVLARHIQELRFEPPENAPAFRVLVLLRDRFTNLTGLTAQFKITAGEWTMRGDSAAALAVFPPRLKMLACAILECDAAEINAMIASIGRLAQLVTLRLHLPDTKLVRFAPLASSSLPLLREFSLDSDGSSVLDNEQLDDLRAMHRVHHMSVHKLNGRLHLLLRTPHVLEWQELSVLQEGLLLSAGCRLLGSLRCLTTLNAWIGGDQINFLLDLPKLTTLTLRLRTASVPVDEAIAVLAQCPQLTSLALTGGEFTEDHLRGLFEHLPDIHSFSLSHCSSVHSLSFLSVPSLMENLQEFELQSCLGIPLSELHHLHGLRNLDELRLYRSFNRRMSPELESRYTAPTALIPSLQYLLYDPPIARFDPQEQDEE